MMSVYRRHISVAGRTRDLPAILQFLETACGELGLEPGVAFDLTLAVEEACANVIEHAYAGAGGPLDLGLETRGRDIVILVRDRGPSFDGAKISKPAHTLPLERRPVGGLGLHLMYTLMDQVEFSVSAEGGNLLTMVKRKALPAGWMSDEHGIS